MVTVPDGGVSKGGKFKDRYDILILIYSNSNTVAKRWCRTVGRAFSLLPIALYSVTT
jgi:hypothetical protein